MDKLKSAAFFPLNLLEATYPVKTDLVYAQAKHPDNHFPGLYHAEAKYVWVEKRVLRVLLLAALLCKHRQNWTIKVNDVLRPVEAQEKMLTFGAPEAFFSRPGNGAHPRGMAFDIEPLSERGERIAMGTPYDFFTEDLKNNPAARDATSFPGSSKAQALEIVARRNQLEGAVAQAAAVFGIDMIGLPHEWWDFRVRKGDEPGRRTESFYWSDYEPAYERDLPFYMRLVGAPEPIPRDVLGRFENEISLINQEVWGHAERLGVARAAR